MRIRTVGSFPCMSGLFLCITADCGRLWRAVQFLILPRGRVFTRLQVGEDGRFGQEVMERTFDRLTGIMALLDRPAPRDQDMHREKAA